jgi:hypothetical protein
MPWCSLGADRFRLHQRVGSGIVSGFAAFNTWQCQAFCCLRTQLWTDELLHVRG